MYFTIDSTIESLDDIVNNKIMDASEKATLKVAIKIIKEFKQLKSKSNSFKPVSEINLFNISLEDKVQIANL